MIASKSNGVQRTSVRLISTSLNGSQQSSAPKLRSTVANSGIHTAVNTKTFAAEIQPMVTVCQKELAIADNIFHARSDTPAKIRSRGKFT